MVVRSDKCSSETCLLLEIGVWNEVEKERTCPVEDMQVWDGISSARIDFSAATSSPFTSTSPRKPMSTMVENLNLQRAALRILRKKQTSGQVEILDGRKVLSIDAGDGGWPVISLSPSSSDKDGQGKSVQARLLVRFIPLTVMVDINTC